MPQGHFMQAPRAETQPATVVDPSPWTHRCAELRTPKSSLRVADATDSNGTVLRPYLEIRARVVAIAEPGSPTQLEPKPDFHAVLTWELNGAVKGLVADDFDLVVWCPTASLWSNPQTQRSRWQTLQASLAPGGHIIVVTPTDLDCPALPSLPPATNLELRIDDGPFVVFVDKRAAVPNPPGLARLDRTMCVDRKRVLRELMAEPWQPTPSDATATDLQRALLAQLDQGELNLDGLPWPRIRKPHDGVERCHTLVLMPHPDDESLYAGGTLAGLAAAGYRIHLMTATAGAGGRGGQHLERRRGAELIEAAARLDLQHVSCLGWPDTGKYRDRHRAVPLTAVDVLRSWDSERCLAQLVTRFREHRPKQLLTLDPMVDPNYSLHGHHLALGLLAAVAFHLANDPNIVTHDVRGRRQSPWTITQHRVMAPDEHARASTADSFSIDRRAKQHAIAAHHSQSYSTRRVITELADQRTDAREVSRRLQGHALPCATVVRSLGTHPAAGIDWQAAADRTLRGRSQDRDALVRLLERQATRWLPNLAWRDQTEQALARLRQPNAVVVTAGQQVGLLGGPAFVLGKILGAVALAHRLRQQGIEAIAVFWMATQDHDAAEVSHVPLLEAPAMELGLARDRRPVGDRSLPQETTSLIDTFIDQLADAGDPLTVHRVHDQLASAYRPGATLADAYARFWLRVLEPCQLLFVDPSDREFARLAAPVLRDAIAGHDRVRRSLAAARRRLEANGHREVVPTHRNVYEVLCIDEIGHRSRLAPDDGDVPTSGQARNDLESLLRQNPEQLSPSALLRPVVQNAVFPVVAQIAGPTEARYLEQTHELHAALNVQAATVITRPSLRVRNCSDDLLLARAGGVMNLHQDANAWATLGRAGLGDDQRRWLALLEEQTELVRAQRVRLKSATGPRPGQLTPSIERVIAVGDALAGRLPVHPRHWAQSKAAVGRAMAQSNAQGPRQPGQIPSTRPLTRILRSLERLRSAALRTGRRHNATAVAAWRRIASDPVPSERRMTVAEAAIRFGADLPSIVHGALVHDFPAIIDIQRGRTR